MNEHVKHLFETIAIYETIIDRQQAVRRDLECELDAATKKLNRISGQLCNARTGLKDSEEKISAVKQEVLRHIGTGEAYESNGRVWFVGRDNESYSLNSRRLIRE